MASGLLYPWASAPLSRRLAAGLADLVIQGGVAILVLLGQSSLGVLPRAEHAPALLLFMVAFSFLYTVVPMAFWGQTPGMSAAAIAAMAADGENPSFPQCALRWLGSVATTALLGLPLLLCLGTGGSLGDRLSHTATVATETSDGGVDREPEEWGEGGDSGVI
ncbi:MAG: RDD family protein [Acidobacteriota bacterium]